MAYQLQPGLAIVENAGALPPVKATEEVFVYPQPSNLNYCDSRPNTMLYGTAPTWREKVPQPDLSRQVMNFVLNLPLVLTRSLYLLMNVTSSHSLIWNARFPFEP